jgi:hypothetical protein
MGRGKGKGGNYCDSVDTNLIGLCACCSVSLIIIISFLVGFSFRILNYDEYGLLVNRLSGAVQDDGKAYDTGRHFTGLGHNFERFPKTFQTIEFAAPNTVGGDEGYVVGQYSGQTYGPVTVRTQDGQLMDVEVSFQYRLIPKNGTINTLFKMYQRYGKKCVAACLLTCVSNGCVFRYKDFFISVARKTFRDIAASHPTSDFFEQRIEIETEMEHAVMDEIAQRYGQVVAFQLRKVIVQPEYRYMLGNITMQMLEISKAEKVVIATEIRTNTTSDIAEIQAQKDREVVRIQQEATNAKLLIQLDESRIREEGGMEVARVNADLAKNVSLWNAQVENERQIIEGTIIEVDRLTVEDIAVVNAERDILSTLKDYNITRLYWDAWGVNRERYAEAAKQDVVLRAKALALAYQNLRDELGFNPTDINTLHWAEVMGDHPSSNIFLDLQKPESFALPGQTDTLKKQLNAEVV